MGHAAPIPDWPGQDPVAIAIAAKIAMLAAASRTCAAEPSSQDQRDLLEEVGKVTARKHVGGKEFPEFLADAKVRLETRAHEERLDSGPVGETLNDILAGAKPVDIVGALYADLVHLASEVCKDALGERFNPRLEREVLEDGPDRPFPFRGGVPASRTYVSLVLYAADFDLRSLALIPYVLTHELVCHIGARHIGHGKRAPDPAIRMFFSDGFMDRVAWLLLMLWIDSKQLEHDVPVGHLAESDVEYASRRPHAFRAGRAAWSNCTAALSARMHEDVATSERAVSAIPAMRQAAEIQSSAVARSIETALRLNACASGIAEKDEFVETARASGGWITGLFADVARRQAEPLQLLERAAATRSGSARPSPSAP
jgi:hypothetical protein